MATKCVSRNQDIAKLVKDKCKSIDNCVVDKYLSSYVTNTGLINTKFIKNDCLLRYVNKLDPIIATSKKVVKHKTTKQVLPRPEDMV
jgi:hypothetical protein